MTSKLQGHPSLPAPVVHAGFSVSQSKSHVLAGVQDAYWSDDEADDADCPLCLEEMDISDINFKPCVCGYQICRFCWHHIKENLNKRCPACRRVYTDEAVEFKAIDSRDHKRLTQQKKQRDRERKELENLGRRHLANMRIVQRNVVYVVGIGPRFAKEELIPTLRSQEYFGQYGKISKILLVKRNQSGGGAPVVGLYITYHRREDAARAISAVDGTNSPGGGRDIMRASYGTTKYCMAFLRGVNCSDNNCMNLHEWGDEKDCFTKEDLTTLKHTMKATEGRTRSGKESDGLPRSAAWASRSSGLPPAPGSSRQGRRGGRQQRNGVTTSTAHHGHGEARSGQSKSHRAVSGRSAPRASSSRPNTPPPASLPAKPPSPVEKRASKHKKGASHITSPAVPTVHSRTPSLAAESDHSSAPVEAPPSPEPRPESADSSSTPPDLPDAPPGLPAIPPGLSAPPGLPTPSRPPRLDSASPQTPLLQSNYQMSNAARALLDDVTARRQNSIPIAAQVSPFPDLDRTLEAVTGGDGSFGGFSFNLDPSLAGTEEPEPFEPLQPPESEPVPPFNGTFYDAFPALRTPSQGSPFMTPPGLSYPSKSIYDPLMTGSGRPPSAAATSIEKQSTGGSTGYVGSFNPFADSNDDTTPGTTSPSRSSALLLDDDGSTRKVSRFGFARGRQGSMASATASPAHVSSPLSNVTGDSSFMPSTNVTASAASSQEYPPSPAQPHWTPQATSSRQDVTNAQFQLPPSPLASHAHAHAHQPPPPSSKFQPFDTSASGTMPSSGSGVSEAQLRDLIQSSRERAALRVADAQAASTHYKSANTTSSSYGHANQYADPAIMSASFSPGLPASAAAAMYHQHQMDPSQQQISFGPPPGLSFPMGALGEFPLGMSGVDVSHVFPPVPERSPTPAPEFTPSDFPALPPAPTAPEPATETASNDEAAAAADEKAKEKAERKAAKKAAAAEKAAERAKIAQEKAAAKAAEKARIAQEKAAEKEKAAALKAEQERIVKEKAEQERLAKEKERAEKAERERLAQLAKEKEREVQAEKERAAQAKRAAAAAAKQQQEAEAQKARKAAQAAAVTSQSKPATVARKESLVSLPEAQVPLLSKKPKKNKPIATKPIRVTREDSVGGQDETATLPSATASEAPPLPTVKPETATGTPSSNNSRVQSRAQSVERDMPASIQELLEDIHIMNPSMDLPTHPFFDLGKINPAAEMPVEYAPLVHALSALSVGGGGSFANNVPAGSMDNAVTNFQQLLETLTNTISDLLHLLPRTTWDDNSSFNGSLQDMMKGEETLDGTGDDAGGASNGNGPQGNKQVGPGGGRGDDVAALTLALERRARWMEVQLSKLEELHRDINTAAVRAILAFNDNGWDRHGFLPHGKNALKRFDSIGLTEENGVLRAMSSAELEKKLVVAKEAASFAEAEVREMMSRMQYVKPTYAL